VNGEQTSSGSRTIAAGVGNGTTRSYGAAFGLTNGSYSMTSTIFNTNPLTSANWALADLSTLQACVKTIS
jgi:hypothetical protein